MNDVSLLDSAKFVVGAIPNADLAYGDPDSDFVNMGKFRRALFQLCVKATTGTIKITAQASAAAAGTSPTAVAFRYRLLNRAGTPVDTIGAQTAVAATGLTTAANADGIYLIEVRASDLPEGKPFVGLNLEQVAAGAVVGAMPVILTGGRFRGPNAPSAVS